MVTTSNVFGEDYGWYKGIGSARGNSVLPPQILPKSKKNFKWEKACLDGLEREGIIQYASNIKLADMYNMISGKLAYMDISEDDTDMLHSYITDFKSKNMNIPKHIKHYDLMYPLVSKIVGEWSMYSDKLRFDTTDQISTNEYVRERTDRLSKYSQALFQSELNKLMLLNGYDVPGSELSEEEMQQAEQRRQSIIQDYFPDKIDADLKKNFKTEAAIWSERTWERDYERFRMHLLESMEARDIILSGKSARHYLVGYDYYYPEYWHPIEVFHSKESSVTRMEDCEFVGRVKWYTVTEIINRYGDLLSEKKREQIYKAVFGPDYNKSTEHSNSYQNTSLLGQGYFQNMMVPFKGYSDHKLALEFEQATGIPLSERTDIRTGNVTPEYSMPLGTNLVGFGSRMAQVLRTDIEIRTDTIQVTEAYWKGSKRVGILTIRAKSGYLDTKEVDEDILPDILKDNEVKNLKETSLSEYNLMTDDEKANTVVWVDTPIVYKGIKIRVSGIGLSDDIYIVEELPYQIRGEKGNMFDVKLPVCGHIGNSVCEIIRPYQIAYNYLMNQVNDYLLKEVGAFFVIDVNAIPTEYFSENGTADDALYEIRNVAKTTGFLPTDFSRNNLMQQGGISFNPMVYNNASFTEPIQRNIQLAERYKWMAYETLGLTPQVMGTPSQYATNEGIQQGQRAYFAQMHSIDQTLMENKRANAEIHLRVAQYCQMNNRDANYVYMASSNEIEYLGVVKDEDFDLRQIDVRSTYDPKKHNMFMQLKQALIQNNTMGADALSLAELFSSDSFLELKDAAIRARRHAEKMQQQKMEHDSQMQQKDMELKMKIHQDNLDLGYARIQGSIQSKHLDALGRSSDKQADQTYIQEINKQAERSLEEQKMKSDDENEKLRIQNDLTNATNKFNNELQKINLEKQKLQLEREKLANMRYIADNNKSIAVVNKN